MANTGLPKVAQYVKNVGKSVVFASIGAVTENTEGIREFAEDNKEVFAEIYAPIANWRQTIKDVKTSIERSNVYKVVDYGIKNIMDDIKTGNFYNDRSYDVSETALGLDDESLGMDFDYGGSDDDYDDDSYEDSSKAEKSFSDSFNKAIGAAATAQSTVVAQGTEMIIKTNKASTTYIGAQIERSAATISSSMGAVYNSIDKVNQFLAGPMRNHLENTKTYQETTLKIMQEEQAMIKELLEMQRNLYKAKDRDYRSSKLEDSMTSAGNVNLAGYLKVIKGNLSEMADEFGLSMFDLDGSSGMNPLMLFAAAPLKMLIDGMVQKMLPKDFKSGLKSFDHGVTTLFSQFIAKMNKASDSYEDEDAFMGTLAKIFGVKVKKKDNINPSNYTKGPVPFDGITRQTIIEVIPGYLARIEASLTGNGERYYDNNRGTWKSAIQIQKEFEEEKARTISYANMDLRNDLQPLINEIAKQSKYDAEVFEKSMHAMMEKLYEDFGDFKADLVSVKNEKTGRTEYVSSDNSDAWFDYGFADKENFDKMLRHLSPRTIRSLAANNMSAREQYAKNMEEHEANGGIYTKLFNGTWDNKGTGSTSANKPSGFNGKSLLSLSKDEYGNDVFYYLREILSSISHRRGTDPDGAYYSGSKFNGRPFRVVNGSSGNRESETSSESEDDPGSHGEVNWDSIEYELDKEAAEAYEKSKKKKTVSDWLSNKLEKSAIGRFFNKAINGVSNIISSPFKFATELLEKANDNMFTMMFGDKDYTNMKDDEGNPINNVFQYMIYKVNKSFKELTDKVGSSVKDMYDDYLRPFVDIHIKPIWERYGQPITDEIKDLLGKGGRRVKKAFRNTFGSAFDNFNKPKDDDGNKYEEDLFHMASNLANGGVVGADEAEAAAKNTVYDDGLEYDNDLFSAKGRLVTKRGLTMISPGEMIIPASSDPKKQNRMLWDEKRDKSRILKAFKTLNSRDIGLNAKGTVNTEKMKEELHRIYEENTGRKAAKVGAGGILGGLGGLLTGINPLLGAAAGAGISILTNSDTLKNIVFGKEILDKEGNVTGREGGIVSKKIYDIFTKAAPDMGDFGIAGGLLGLMTPFGPLGGAAIGAGIGYLKNSESFKKFIFGDEAIGEEGLIKKESYEKFKELVKKSVPNILIGAGAGILTGPFGLLGNAAMGAGLGLLTSTDSFHKFVFGDENSGGIVSAFQNGILDPAKDHITEILADFKGYARENIFEPLKKFWDPFKQTLKNIIKGTADSIKDHINDMFERTIGIPMADFLQEKIFKPLTNTFFKIIKLPINLGKTVLAAPFKLLGAIGDSRRAGMIRKGSAYDMSASERLAYRDEHKFRFGKFNGFFHRDNMLEEDRMLANMDEETLSKLASTAKANALSKAELQNKVGKARQAVGREVSAFFNEKGENGKSRYGRVNYESAKQIAAYAANGELDKALSMIDMLNLTDAEKDNLKERLTEKSNAATKANKEMELANTDSKELDKELSRLLGRKVKNRKDRRQIYQSAEAELVARKKAAASLTEEDKESPEEKATNNLTDMYDKRSNAIIELFKIANQRLAILINPEVALKDSENTQTDLAESAVENANKSLAVSEGINDAAGIVNGDSKKAVEQKNKEEAEEAEEADNLATNKETNTILTKLTEGLLGKNKKNDKEDKKDGLLGKIFGGIGTVGKFLGIGALSIARVSLFGHLTEWFKTSVWPKMKEFLFGVKAEDGTTVKEGLVGSIKTLLLGSGENAGLIGKAGVFLFGEDGKSGPLSPIANFFKEIKQEGIGPWVSKNVLPRMVAGIGYAIENIVPTAVALLIKHGPNLVVSLGKAIIDGISIAAGWNKDIKRDTSDEISSNEALAEFERVHSTNKSKLAKNLGPSVTSLFNSSSSAYKPAGSATISYSSILGDNYKDSDSTYTYDGKHLNKTSDEILYENAPGLPGMLGAKQLTNDIYYDENGNIALDSYKTFNTTNSLASTVADVTGRGFIRGVMGARPATALAKRMAKAGTKGIGKGWFKFGTGILGRTTKAAGKVMSTGANLGSGVNNLINQGLFKNASDEAAQAFIDGVVAAGGGSADDIAKLVSEKGITEAAKTIFKGTSDKAVKHAALQGGRKANSAIKNAKELLIGSADNVVDDIVEVGAKSADNLVSKAVKGITDAASKATDNIAAKVAGIFANLADSEIIEYLLKACSAGTTKTMLREAMEKIGRKLGDNLIGRLAKKALGSIANVLGKFSPVTIVFWVMDFVYGFDNAETLLGVAKGDLYKVGFGQKCLCGLLNMINNQLTLGLIPTDLIIDIIVEFLFPLFGLDAKSLKEARERTEDILDKWNKEHPEETYSNLEDFNNKDKWWFKASKKFKQMTKSNAKSSTSSTTSATQTGSNYINGNTSLVTGSPYAASSNVNTSASSNYSGPYAGRARSSSAVTGVINRFNSKIYNNEDSFYNLSRKINKDEKKIKKALDGKMDIFSKEYWDNSEYTGTIGGLSNTSTYLHKLLNAPVVIIKKISTTISESLTELKSFFGEEYKAIWEWFSNFFKPVNVGGSGSSSSRDTSPINSNINPNTSMVAAFGRSGKGKRNRYGLGHVYQSNKSISNISYGDSTIGEAGCAPVAATNLINSIGADEWTNLNEAASFAENNRMTVPGGGTDIRYFNSFLESKGIPTSNTNNKNTVIDALRRGNQVVMLGKDNNDDPGAPFGTTPHFVTAKGITNNGKIIAEDPDLPYSDIEYNAEDIMNSMVTSVIANTAGRKKNRKKNRLNNMIAARARSKNTNIIQDNFIRSAKLLGAQAIINVAMSQIGVTEGNNPNQVKYNYAIYNRANAYGDSYAWCVVFVWWVFNQAGASKLFCGGKKEYGCGNVARYYQGIGKYDMDNPKPGDLAIVKSPNSTAKYPHIIIVKEVIDSDTIRSIEGNCGNKVASRLLKKKDIVGFCHIDYPYEYDKSSVVDMRKWGDDTDYEFIARNGGSMNKPSSSNKSTLFSSDYSSPVNIDSVDSNTSGVSNTSSSKTLFSALTDLGKSMLKSMFGADAYEALYGSSTTDEGNDSNKSTTNNTSTALTGNSDRDKIWNYLTKTAGYTKNAASGIMGCWERESGNKSKRIEGDYLKGFPGYDTLISNRSEMNKWAERLFKAYEKDGISINKNGYKGTDGHYYPGIGLAQWTGPRGYNLFNYAKKSGANWGSLENQLAFFDSEINSRKIKDLLNSSTSPEDGAHKFLDRYEMSPGFGEKNPKMLSDRQKSAKQIYNTYSGSGRTKNITNHGSAARALNSMNNNVDNSYTNSNNANYSINRTEMVDYQTFLQTIITVLLKISDNTALLSSILEILANNFNLDISKDEIIKVKNSNRVKAERALSDLISRNGGAVNMSKVMNNKDTSYLLSAMAAIASE